MKFRCQARALCSSDINLRYYRTDDNEQTSLRYCIQDPKCVIRPGTYAGGGVWSANTIAMDMTRAISEIHIMAAPTDRRGGGVCRMWSDIGNSSVAKTIPRFTNPL